MSATASVSYREIWCTLLGRTKGYIRSTVLDPAKTNEKRRTLTLYFLQSVRGTTRLTSRHSGWKCSTDRLVRGVDLFWGQIQLTYMYWPRTFLYCLSWCWVFVSYSSTAQMYRNRNCLSSSCTQIPACQSGRGFVHERVLLPFIAESEVSL